MTSKYGNKKCYVDGHKFDSHMECDYYYRLKVLKDKGEILDFKVHPKFMLQPSFKYNGKTILPIKYRSDYNVVWADGTLQVFDVKGNPDNLSLLKRKLMWAKYPEANLTFICRNLKFGGWIEFDELKKKRRETKKRKVKEKKGNEN